ncbi:hypothetical protein GA0070624_4432 [Micromonospora rhizosphaerae]|uniref:Glycosyl transferases group 1 n=1 Tax=Micromonospora rhizosphaerae TaxID=568872 RepID=A0A1C6SS18_9ACTN|nr:hypothetical protein [Micromonospora rhizosphaerae]SCL32267.1 hypothetical protein GA0070624_4432 [Micromonospora rhizosphaerae]
MPGNEGRLRIVFGEVMSRIPFSAGMAWSWMQWAVGLRRLGHEVIYVEELRTDRCIDEHGEPCPPEMSLNREFFLATMRRFGFEGSSWQIDRHGAPIAGSRDDLHRQLAGADLLINMTGHIRADSVLEQARHRVYIDLDPVYTQLWHAEYGKGEKLGIDRHDAFATVGLNIGTPASEIPSCGLEWRHVLPPVVPDMWTGPEAASDGRFTTIASWESFADLVYDGQWYRGKRASFERLAELPSRIPGQELELALRRQTSDDELLAKKQGWHVVDAGRVAGDLDSYHDYVTASRGEIGIAKDAYIRARSGWFSDRSAHYLAAGRPVVAQATGAEDHLPTGTGLLVFDTCESAAEAIEDVNGAYEAHCRGAREIAAEYLDYRRVLPPFLEACLS